MLSMTKPILCIAGPTASGKSALALEIAEKQDGEIIGADAMQIYAALPILSAQPTPEDLARATHHLVGHIPADEPYSVGRWLGDAIRAIKDIRARGKRPIIVGGTGLYFRALTTGLAEIPEPSAEAKTYAAELTQRGEDSLRQEATRLDSEAAARILPGDTRRLARIVAVARGTPRKLSDWHRDTNPAISANEWVGGVVQMEREQLDKRIRLRFDRMLEAGLMEEVKAFDFEGLSADAPVRSMIGLATLHACIRGEVSQSLARENILRETRQYAKRQRTWFRGQMKHWPNLPAAKLHLWLDRGT